MTYFNDLKTANEIAEHETNWQEKDMSDDEKLYEYEGSNRATMDEAKRGTQFGDPSHRSEYIDIVAGSAVVDSAAIALAMHQMGCTSDHIRKCTS